MACKHHKGVCVHVCRHKSVSVHVGTSDFMQACVCVCVCVCVCPTIVSKCIELLPPLVDHMKEWPIKKVIKGDRQYFRERAECVCVRR